MILSHALLRLVASNSDQAQERLRWLRFRLRSSSQVWPLVLIQFDASSSEDPSNTSSEGLPSRIAHADQMGA